MAAKKAAGSTCVTAANRWQKGKHAGIANTMQEQEKPRQVTPSSYTAYHVAMHQKNYTSRGLIGCFVGTS